MSNKLVVIGIVAVCVAAWMKPATVNAQDFNAAATYYCQGVNAFFNGQSGQAELNLSRAIELAAQDPRPYYFRSILRLRQGRSDEARSDMQTGAEMEARLPHRYAIGTELQRIQGTDRLLLEEYRRNARANAVVANGAANNPNAPDRDSAVLRDRRMIPIDELLRPGGPRAVSAAPAPTANTVGQPPTAVPALPPAAAAKAAPPPVLPPQTPPTVPAATAPATASPPLQLPPQPAGDNPFADDSKPAAAAEAPAAAPPSKEAPAEAKPATPPAATDEDPFSGL